eukprot:s697_g21.t1
MVSSSASRSRSTRRSPERRKSPPKEPERAVAASLETKKEEEKGGDGSHGDRAEGKRSRGSGAVANRRKKGQPGTWQCSDCHRVINDTPSAKKQHRNSVYCKATRLWHERGGDWWEWKDKLEKGDREDTCKLTENPKFRGQLPPPEPKVPPRWDRRYDWDYKTGSERARYRDRQRHRSEERGGRRARSVERSKDSRRGAARERARSSGRNRSRGKESRRLANRPRTGRDEYEEVPEEIPPKERQSRKEVPDKSTEAKVRPERKETPAVATEKTKEEQRKDEKKNAEDEKSGSSDYTYTYDESSSTGEDVAKEVPPAQMAQKVQTPVSAKAGTGKKTAAVPAAPAAGPQVSAQTSTERLQSMFNSFLRTAMEAAHGMETRGPQ